MKPCSNEPFEGDDQAPSGTNTTDFKLLYSRLNEDAIGNEIDPTMIEAVVRMLRLFVNTSRPKIRPDHVGLKVIAMAWLLNPGYFADSPSLRELARRCGVNHTKLAALTGHFSRVIGWRNRAQRRAWNWRRSDRRT